jgi:hypothetical protein
MRNVNLGQIVGFRFDEEKPSKVKKGTMAKIVRIYSDSKFIDHEWLEERKALDAFYNIAPRPATPGAPATPLGGNLPKEEAPAGDENSEAIEAIRNLAKTKGLVLLTDTKEEADEKIEKHCGLKLETENFTKIIIALTSYTK